nr:hypothetical protein [Methylobacterium soli]
MALVAHILEIQRADVSALAVVNVDDPARPIEAAAAAPHDLARDALGVTPDQQRISHPLADPIENGVPTIGTVKAVTIGRHSLSPTLSTGMHRLARLPAALD